MFVARILMGDVELLDLLATAAVPIALIEHVVGEGEVAGIGVEFPILFHVVRKGLFSDGHDIRI